VTEGGAFTYGVRAIPYHPDLPGKFDVGLVTWAERT